MSSAIRKIYNMHKFLFGIYRICRNGNALCKGTIPIEQGCGLPALRGNDNPSVTAAPCHLPLHKGGIKFRRDVGILPCGVCRKEVGEKTIPPALTRHLPYAPAALRLRAAARLLFTQGRLSGRICGGMWASRPAAVWGKVATSRPAVRSKSKQYFQNQM